MSNSSIMVEASVEVMMGFASGRGKQRAALQADKMSTAATKKKDNFWDDMLNEVMVQDLYKQPTRTVAATVDKKDKFWDDVLIEVMEHDLNLNKQTSKAVPVVATNEKDKFLDDVFTELMRQDRYKQPTQVAASTAKKDKFWDDVLAEVMAKDLGLDKWPTQRPSTSEAEIERQKRRQEQKEAEEQQRWNDNQRKLDEIQATLKILEEKRRADKERERATREQSSERSSNPKRKGPLAAQITRGKYSRNERQPPSPMTRCDMGTVRAIEVSNDKATDGEELFDCCVRRGQSLALQRFL